LQSKKTISITLVLLHT